MNTKINVRLVMACLAAILATDHVRAQDVAASGGDKEAVLDTIAQINHINWVVNVIKTYNNALVLEEEYEKISYGNLNLNRIPDEETRNRITNMLDVLYSLRKDEREMKHWRDKFLDDRMRKMREYDLGTAKRVWRLFREGIFGFMTYDIGTVLQTAFDVGHGCLSLQYDYDNFVHSFDQEMQERVFAFDSQKMALLHKLNKEMLDDQWRLVRKYHLDDKTTRVTDTDIKVLLSVLKDGNASRIYTRLVSMKSRYRLFPEYWYYLSCAAMETGHFKEGRDACDTFFKMNRGIFRDDPMAGTVALNKAMMLDKSKGNLLELKRCLEVTWDNNQSKCDWKQDFIVASLYDGILHDNKKAVEILEHAIVGLESEMSERRRKNKSIVSLARTLGEYHAFLFRLLPNEPMPEAIRTSEFISIIDKLRFLSRSKTENGWEIIKDDLLGITSLNKSSNNNKSSDNLDLIVPASWLLNEEVSVKIKVSVGTLLSEEVTEQVSNRKYTAENNTFTLKFNWVNHTNEIDNIISEKMAKLGIEKGIKALNEGFDALQIQIIFDHPDFPVSLCLAEKGMNYKEGEGDWFLFGFTALGKKYDWLPESGLDTPSYSSSVTSQQRYDTFLSKYLFVPLDREEFVYPEYRKANGIHPVKVKSINEGLLELEYRNISENSFRPLVTLVLMNEYGMVILVESDRFFDEYTESYRTVKGIIFDDHYTDRNYKYMSPNEVRTFSMFRPSKAKYLLVRVGARYNLTETYER